MLRAGGKLLIANFVPDLRQTAYMEAYMAWNLVYRDSIQLDAVASGIRSSGIRSSRTFRDRDNCIGYLAVSKKP